MVEIKKIGDTDVAHAIIRQLPIIVEFYETEQGISCGTSYQQMFESAIRGYLRGAVAVNSSDEVYAYYPVLESIPSQTTFGVNLPDYEMGEQYTIIKVDIDGVHYYEI